MFGAAQPQTEKLKLSESVSDRKSFELNFVDVTAEERCTNKNEIDALMHRLPREKGENKIC